MCSLGIVLKLKNKTLQQSVIFASHRILWRRLAWHTSQWFYWINDGNPHLQSPSLENSSAPSAIRPGDKQWKISPNGIITLHHHDKLTPVSAHKGPTCEWLCMRWVVGQKTRPDPQGWRLGGWKMNEKRFFCAYAIQPSTIFSIPHK